MKASSSKRKLDSIFQKHNASDYVWIAPEKIVVSNWVRMKCLYGCNWYGKCSACPPNNPSVEECKKFFREYDQAVLLHYAKAVGKPGLRHSWTRKINQSLLALERAVFLAGYQKAFVLFVDPCNLCAQCQGDRASCAHKALARPSPEGFGVDVFATAKAAGFPIQVLTGYQQTMNRYSILLVK